MYIFDNLVCNDNLFCNGVEICDVVFGCQNGVLFTEDDGVLCTILVCDEFIDTFSYVPDYLFCDNGQLCDGTEICDVIVGCFVGSGILVDDVVVCTVDICDENMQFVFYMLDYGYCNDFKVCIID